MLICDYKFNKGLQGVTTLMTLFWENRKVLLRISKKKVRVVLCILTSLRVQTEGENKQKISLKIALLKSKFKPSWIAYYCYLKNWTLKVRWYGLWSLHAIIVMLTPIHQHKKPLTTPFKRVRHNHHYKITEICLSLFQGL